VKLARDPRAWVLLLAGLPLYFLGAGRIPLLEPDEPFYAVPALEMLRAGSWKVPLLHGSPWFDKPALFYWLVLACDRLFGVSAFAARFASGAAAVGGILVLYALGDPRGSPRARFAAAVILGTSFEYALLGRAAVTDMTFTFFLTGGMLAFSRGLETRRTSWPLLAGAAFGLAALTKGPAGLALPAAGLLLYAALSRSAEPLRPRSLGAITAGILITAAPWYAYMAIAHRELLLGDFLGEGNLGRFLHPEHRSPFYFYAIVLILGMLPWSGALPASFAAALRPPRWAQETAERGWSPALFSICWFAGIVLVFSLSASKLLTYILPAFPPAAILLGSYWSRALDRDAPYGRSLWSGGRIAAGLGALLALGAALAAVRPAAAESWGVPAEALQAMAAALAIGALLALGAAWKSSLRGYLAAQAATTAAILLLGVFLMGPALSRAHSARDLVDELRSRNLTEEIAGAYREKGFSLDFYLERTLPRARGLRALASSAREAPGRLWIVGDPDVRVLEDSKRFRVETVARTPFAAALRLYPATLAAGGEEPHGD
jgi:4-amino-4-deoxy-L-arabinose transferase-like glycosyltransferase